MKHRCPPWCHVCPDMAGDIMPGCYSTINAPDAGLRACCCARPNSRVLGMEDRLELIAHVVTRALESPHSPSEHREQWARVLRLLPSRLRKQTMANLLAPAAAQEDARG